MALGATRPVVVRAFASRAVVLALAGTSLGLVLAAFASRVAASQLYGFTDRDPMAYALAAASLFAISIAAALIAAARAASVDPLTALRQE